MSSVTGRIKEVKQPYGGYVKPSMFAVTMMDKIDDDDVLCESENVHGSIVGMAVDYLTRFVMGASIEDAFSVSLTGMELAKRFGFDKHKDVAIQAEVYWYNIKSFDINLPFDMNYSYIACACKLVTFDVWVRNMPLAFSAKSADEVNVDVDTAMNIWNMVRRSVAFWQKYGPVVKDHFTFEPYGYTDVVDTGDGDYLTVDTLWDFKVSKGRLTSKYTLQLLMYYIMGKHSGQEVYRNMNKLGVYNPRLNTVYTLDVSDIPLDVIRVVEHDVICYS